jgi:hypothetical protein
MSLYEWPRGKAKLSVDFQYMLSRAPGEWLKQLLELLLPLPVVGSKLRDVEAAGFKKRPGIPVEELLSNPTAEKALFDRIGEIVAASSASAQVGTPIGDSAGHS